VLDVRSYLSLLRTFPGDVRAVRQLVERQGRDLERHERELEKVQVELARMLEVLEVIYDEEPANRRRLDVLRKSADYEAAFTDAEPLVSVVIPTFDRYQTLTERAIPSVLNQTYRNVEVVVVGDGSPAAVGEAVARIDDPRIRYQNLNRRGPYPSDGYQAWLVSGTMAFNAAVQQAQGSWIAALDDDDAFRPHHVERLLETAQQGRWEVVTSLQELQFPDGRTETLGEFPPRLSKFNWQATLYHAGLRFFELELADSLFDRPNDWSLCRRWLRAGVRMGFVEEITVDLYPSWAWEDEDGSRREWAFRAAGME
jgi:glycosyltransferase involved in cell wall biosynthesis